MEGSALHKRASRIRARLCYGVEGVQSAGRPSSRREPARCFSLSNLVWVCQWCISGQRGLLFGQGCL